jgi:hypothetical protein
MDQIRTALAWLKRHHFWVLTGLVVLIPLGCWWSSSKKMSATYETGQKTIAAGLTEVQSVLSTPFHPNDTINNHQIAEIKKESDSVAKLWQELYDKQRAEVLKWPASLSKAFRDAVEKMQFNDEISSELRNNYQNYIDAHFKELPKQISARPLEANEGGPGGEMPGGRSYSFSAESGVPGAPGTALEDNDYICEWLDQNVIRDELNFPQRPSSLRIWVTQEDLWVYHTLLDVIAKTNQAAGATRMSNAAVKTVISLEVGQRAAPYSRAPGRLAVPPAAAAAAEAGPGGLGPEGAARGAAGPPGAGGPRGPMPGGPESRMSMGLGSNVALSPAQEQAVLLSGRYLDAKTGQPIMLGGGGGGDAGPVPGGPSAPPAAADAGAGAPTLDLNQFGTSYKQLPVRMVLRMDARWLPQLITACANEPLRVEVQEVRINPPDVSAEGGSVGIPSGFGGRGGMGGGNLFPDHTGPQTFSAQPHVKNIVVQGIIYIFNKPNMNILAPPAEQQTAGM